MPFTHKALLRPCHLPSSGERDVYDVAAAREVLDKIKVFDADENVLVIIAHDWSLFNVLQFDSHSANDCKAKESMEKGRQPSLTAFQKAVDLAKSRNACRTSLDSTNDVEKSFCACFHYSSSSLSHA